MCGDIQPLPPRLHAMMLNKGYGQFTFTLSLFWDQYWYFVTTNRQQMLSLSCPCTNITVLHTNQLMHTIIDTTLLQTLCHCDVFRLSKGNFQGLRQTHYHSKVNKYAADVQLRHTHYHSKVNKYVADVQLRHTLPQQGQQICSRCTITTNTLPQ